MLYPLSYEGAGLGQFVERLVENGIRTRCPVVLRCGAAISVADLAQV